MVSKNKKVIALSCSPSKGRNSDTMLDNFIAGMREVEGVEVEKVYLNDIPFDDYRFEIKDAPQMHEQEFKKLTDKIQSANALVIATPTYNFGVPAHLKNFIDRIRFFALDFKTCTRIGQPAGRLSYLSTYFLVSGGTPLWAQKLLFFTFPPFWLRGVFLYFGAKVMGAFYTGDIEAYQNSKILKKCKKKGKHFAKQVSRGAHHGALEDIFFRPPQVR